MSEPGRLEEVILSYEFFATFNYEELFLINESILNFFNATSRAQRLKTPKLVGGPVNSAALGHAGVPAERSVANERKSIYLFKF